MRSSTPLSLRLLAGLGLGLMLAASNPHLHRAESALGSHGAQLDAPSAGVGGGSSVSSDEHHEQHSARPAGELHPCGLCRSLEDDSPVRWRAWATPFEEAPGALAAKTPPNPVACLFASLHPSRAPPLSLYA